MSRRSPAGRTLQAMDMHPPPTRAWWPYVVGAIGASAIALATLGAAVS
jgi:hypothetical protein